MRKIIKIAIILIFSFFQANLLFGKKLTNVSLELKWLHQFQFAGIYAAKHKGFYKEEGLNLKIIPRNKKSNPIEDVLSGKVQFGISDGTIIREKMKGKDLIILAAIFQHSPLVLMSLDNSQILSPIEMKNKRIMFQKNVDDAIIVGLLSQFGISSDQYIFVPHNFKDSALIDNETDVMSAYLSNQPHYYKEKGINVNIIKPQNYGIDFYGDIIFTSEEFFNNNKEVALAFKRATIKGWEYALENKEEIINLILDKYNPDKSKDALKYEAMIVEQMIAPEYIEIGHVSKNRLEYIAKTYARNELGELDPKDIKGIYYEDNLTYSREYIVTALYYSGILVLLCLMLICIMLFFNYRLKIKIGQRTAKIEQISNTDELTKLYNRRKLMSIFSDFVNSNEKRMRYFSLIMLDIDFFKQINDTYGHNTGDYVLTKVAEILKQTVRNDDACGRWGGEEFVIFCLRCHLDTAIEIAEKIRKRIEEYDFGIPQKVTASFGVSEWDDNIELEYVINLAVKSLYQSKNLGRNRVSALKE